MKGKANPKPKQQTFRDRENGKIRRRDPQGTISLPLVFSFSTLLPACCVSLPASLALFYSVGSPLPQAKHHHPSSHLSSLSPPFHPLAAFPTQSDRRPASAPRAPAIPRRFRAIRRGFGALPAVLRRIGGDRAPGWRSGPSDR